MPGLSFLLLLRNCLLNLLSLLCFYVSAQKWTALCPAEYYNQAFTALAFLKNRIINVNLKSNVNELLKLIFVICPHKCHSCFCIVTVLWNSSVNRLCIWIQSMSCTYSTISLLFYFSFSQAGYSALNMACDNLHVGCAKLLLAVPGIDVNVQNEASVMILKMHLPSWASSPGLLFFVANHNIFAILLIYSGRTHALNCFQLQRWRRSCAIAAGSSQYWREQGIFNFLLCLIHVVLSYPSSNPIIITPFERRLFMILISFPDRPCFSLYVFFVSFVFVGALPTSAGSLCECGGQCGSRESVARSS